MPKVSDMFPSKYLKAGDIDEGDLVLTIEEVTEELFGQGDDAAMKWVAKFGETDKMLVLNKTNTLTIKKLYGNDTDDWVGRQVALYPTEVQFGHEMVEAIRVRGKTPKAQKRSMPPKDGRTAPVKGVEEAMSDFSNDSNDDVPF